MDAEDPKLPQPEVKSTIEMARIVDRQESAQRSCLRELLETGIKKPPAIGRLHLELLRIPDFKNKATEGMSTHHREYKRWNTFSRKLTATLM
jgi:hypothetical protein